MNTLEPDLPGSRQIQNCLTKEEQVFELDDIPIMVFGRLIHDEEDNDDASASTMSIESMDISKMIQQDEKNKLIQIIPQASNAVTPPQGSMRRKTKKGGNAKRKRSQVALKKDKAALMLPDDFKPQPYSVIVGKSKEAKESIGNMRLRILASRYLPRYQEASNTKSKKSKIVSELLSIMHEACPEGAFIRLDNDGRWCRVKDSVAREKIGYTFRELLGDSYRSSSKAKAVMRAESSVGQLWHRRDLAIGGLNTMPRTLDTMPLPPPSIAAADIATAAADRRLSLVTCDTEYFNNDDVVSVCSGVSNSSTLTFEEDDWSSRVWRLT